MTPSITNYAQLWKDERYFAQITPSNQRHGKPSPDCNLVDQVLAVATDLLGNDYKLGKIKSPFKPRENLEVYDTLTQILPVLSSQSEFFWKVAARTLASQLATAKYPIHSQASHLIFWWARLGGLMGPVSPKDRKGDQSHCTFDGSTLEFSWAIPHNTDPLEESNRKIRFTIDPYHPELGRPLAGGAVTDYLWSDEGSLGIIKNEAGSKEWKDTIERWLFPDIENSEELIEGAWYMLAFDMEPSGKITIKQYYAPPYAPPPGSLLKNRVALQRITEELEPLGKLAKTLHPSLEGPFNMVSEYLSGDGKDSEMKWFLVACDILKSEKNRLKLYWISPGTTMEDMIRDMTLGGKLTGPHIDEAMVNFKKFYTHLCPFADNDNTRTASQPYVVDEKGHVGRRGLRVMYYYELFVGRPIPYPKIYFFVDDFNKNDLQTAKATEAFFKDVGKPGEDGWVSNALAHAYDHRPLEKRSGVHSMLSFGLSPSGWEVTNYYSAEIYAPEREAHY